MGHQDHWPTPGGVCPDCGRRLNCAESVGHGRPPTPGDVTFCIGCAALLVFTDDLQVRSPTHAEWAVFAASPQLRTIHERLAAFIADNPPPD